MIPRQFVWLRYSAPKLRKNIVRLCPRLTSGRTKRGGVSCAQGNMSDPLGSQNADTPLPCSRRSCVVVPGRPHYERSDDRNPEYSPSGTSSLSPLFHHRPRSLISIPRSPSQEEVCGDVHMPHCHHRHCNLLVNSLSACSLQVHVEFSRKNQLCPPWPLRHCRHHIPNRCVFERCQVTVGPVALSCVSFYRPTMVVIVVAAVVVAMFINAVAVVILGAGRPPYVPLPPCHPTNGENTKAWV